MPLSPRSPAPHSLFLMVVSTPRGFLGHAWDFVASLGDPGSEGLQCTPRRACALCSFSCASARANTEPGLPALAGGGEEGHSLSSVTAAAAHTSQK